MSTSLRMQILAMASTALTAIAGCGGSDDTTPHSEMGPSGSESATSGSASCGGNNTCGASHPAHAESTTCDTPRCDTQPASTPDAGMGHGGHPR